MDQDETPHPEYQKGFNEGYVMTKHLPELAEKIAPSLGKSSRSEGFQDGRNQVIVELEKSHHPTWLKGNRLSNLDKSIDKNKEKNIDEPER